MTTEPDIGDTLAPKSDQMNADDLLTGPRTFTVDRVVVRRGSEEQPVDVYLKEFPAKRPFKPSKSMRRVMYAAWGEKSATYPGHQFTLFRDPGVTFGGAEVGGVRISHMSHLPGNKPLNISLTTSKAKREPYTVLPLAADAAASPIVAAETLAKMVTLFEQKGIAEDARLPGVNKIIRGSATALETITEAEAVQVIFTLEAKPDPEPGPDPGGQHDYVNDPETGACSMQLSDGTVCGELEDRPPHVAAAEE